MAEAPTVRPTKKQREILTYIEQFITAHGYSPSYREIMKGLNYTSVATVSLHVNSLIQRGHLRKRDHSARSIEVVSSSEQPKVGSNQVTASQEKWLVEKINHYFKQAEQEARPSEDVMDSLFVLVGALKVLGLDGAVQSFIPKLSALKQKTKNPADK
jgi:repressor LexA